MPKVDVMLKGRLQSLPEKQAKALVKHGIAKYPVETKPMTYGTRALRAAPAAAAVPDELAAARAEYEVALGKKPYYAWDAETLREKIAEASATKAADSAEPADDADASE